MRRRSELLSWRRAWSWIRVREERRGGIVAPRGEGLRIGWVWRCGGVEVWLVGGMGGGADLAAAITVIMLLLLLLLMPMLTCCLVLDVNRTCHGIVYPLCH